MLDHHCHPYIIASVLGLPRCTFSVCVFNCAGEERWRPGTEAFYIMYTQYWVIYGINYHLSNKISHKLKMTFCDSSTPTAQPSKGLTSPLSSSPSSPLVQASPVNTMRRTTLRTTPNTTKAR